MISYLISKYMFLVLKKGLSALSTSEARSQARRGSAYSDSLFVLIIRKSKCIPYNNSYMNELNYNI